MHSTFMGWVQHLPELGDPVRSERARLVAKLNEAHLLERRASQLVAEARAEAQLLLSTVARNWSLFEIESAGRRAGVERRSLGLATVRDDELRKALQQLDEHLTAGEAVRVFGAADVLRQESLHHASDAERLAALDRLLAWWTFAGKPVYERLEARPPVPGVGTEPNASP